MKSYIAEKYLYIQYLETEDKRKAFVDYRAATRSKRLSSFCTTPTHTHLTTLRKSLIQWQFSWKLGN